MTVVSLPGFRLHSGSVLILDTVMKKVIFVFVILLAVYCKKQKVRQSLTLEDPAKLKYFDDLIKALDEVFEDLAQFDILISGHDEGPSELKIKNAMRKTKFEELWGEVEEELASQDYNMGPGYFPGIKAAFALDMKTKRYSENFIPAYNNTLYK